MTITAAEQTIIEHTNVAIAAGEDPFGDEDGFEATATTAPANDQAAAGDTAGEGTDNQIADDTNVDAAALEAIANSDDAPAQAVVADPLNFNVNAPADYKATRTTLLAEKAEAMGKLMNGEIDTTEYAAIESRVMDTLEDLSAQRIRSETLQELNTQSAAQSQSSVINSLIARTAAEVPYATEAKAQRQFDMALSSLSADPDMAGKPFADLASEAHRVVMALRGLTPKTTAAEAASARLPKGQAPVTLRSLPNASTSNTGGNMVDQLSRLSGQDYEAAYNKLTPSQKASMLDE
jgi:hypothetical protein